MLNVINLLINKLNVLAFRLFPVLGDIRIRSDFDANNVLRQIVTLFGVGIFVAGLISGVIEIAKGAGDPDGGGLRRGVFMIVMAFLLGGSLVTIINLVLA